MHIIVRADNAVLSNCLFSVIYRSGFLTIVGNSFFTFPTCSALYLRLLFSDIFKSKLVYTDMDPSRVSNWIKKKNSARVIRNRKYIVWKWCELVRWTGQMCLKNQLLLENVRQHVFHSLQSKEIRVFMGGKKKEKIKDSIVV